MAMPQRGEWLGRATPGGRRPSTINVIEVIEVSNVPGMVSPRRSLSALPLPLRLLLGRNQKKVEQDGAVAKREVAKDDGDGCLRLQNSCVVVFSNENNS